MTDDQPRWWVRSRHPMAFKSGEWAEIVGMSTVNDRRCLEVLFDDGSVDTWVLGDHHADYQWGWSGRGTKVQVMSL